MIDVSLAGSSSKRLRLATTVTYRWLLEDRLCVSFRDHPAELMDPGGRIWAPQGVVIAVSRDVSDTRAAWAAVEEDTGQRATTVPPKSWRRSDYQYVQLDWTDGADSFLTGVIFEPSLGGVMLTYIANDMGGEYMPRDLAARDPRCVMAHVEVELGT